MRFQDTLTLMWKDLRELPRIYGESKAGLLGFVFPVLIIGVMLPLQMGEKWLKPGLSLIFAVWFPVIMVFTMVADSFAGERERKTLEALLATRLSDRAILAAKLLTAICFALAFVLVLNVVGVITLNLAHLGGGKFLFFPLRVFALLLLLPPLSAFAASGIGVLVSLRAGTVRQAQQTLMMSGMLLFFIPTLVIPMLPKEMREAVFAFFTAGGVELLAAVAALVLLAIGVVTVLLADKLFRRARLILD
ncbi:ABC transporter permease subunit [bacterium]|nr:ABC transporter permease subunit [bacterium]